MDNRISKPIQDRPPIADCGLQHSFSVYYFDLAGTREMVYAYRTVRYPLGDDDGGSTHPLLPRALRSETKGVCEVPELSKPCVCPIDDGWIGPGQLHSFPKKSEFIHIISIHCDRIQI